MKIRFAYLGGPTRSVCVECGGDPDYDSPMGSLAVVSENPADGTSELIGYFCSDCASRFTEDKGITGFLGEPTRSIHPAKSREALRRVAKRYRALAREMAQAGL